jgi:hypothetical protein
MGIAIGLPYGQEIETNKPKVPALRASVDTTKATRT